MFVELSAGVLDDSRLKKRKHGEGEVVGESEGAESGGAIEDSNHA